MSEQETATPAESQESPPIVESTPTGGTVAKVHIEDSDFLRVWVEGCRDKIGIEGVAERLSTIRGTDYAETSVQQRSNKLRKRLKLVGVELPKMPKGNSWKPDKALAALAALGIVPVTAPPSRGERGREKGRG